MMTPPTFRTFRRELSSVWQTVAYPRKACNVLEQLSGATERRMIVLMTVRPQQRYDHRLRDLIQRTGDVTIATDLGVSRSTARGWLGQTPKVVIRLDVTDMSASELQQALHRNVNGPMSV